MALVPEFDEHLGVGGHLAYFHFLLILNKDARSNSAEVFMSENRVFSSRKTNDCHFNTFFQMRSQGFNPP